MDINLRVFNTYFTYVDYNTVWAAIAVFIYVIGYFSLKQPELFRMELKEIQNPKEKEMKDRLSIQESTILKQKMDSLMITEKIYLKNNLTLVEISNYLETSVHNVFWLLNNTYKSTFYDFINGYRINEFVRKVEKKEHLNYTILTLSFDAGFNFKSTFNKVFKAIMNDTPSNFIKNHRAA